MAFEARPDFVEMCANDFCRPKIYYIKNVKRKKINLLIYKSDKKGQKFKF